MNNVKELKPIIIQGAMDIELNYILEKLESKEEKIIAGYIFFEGTINSYPVIVMKTYKGVINAAISTTVAIKEFNPCIIINQGMAGSHLDYINIKDIIIGKGCININAFSMPVKSLGEGSLPFDWEYNKRAKNVIYSDKKLLEIAENIEYTESKKYIGIIGSGDIHNREIDRINWIRKKQNTICEEQEGIGVYEACLRFSVPCIGIRVISNNEIIEKDFDESVNIFSQKFVIKFVKKVIKELF